MNVQQTLKAKIVEKSSEIKTRLGFEEKLVVSRKRSGKKEMDKMIEHGQ